MPIGPLSVEIRHGLSPCERVPSAAVPFPTAGEQKESENLTLPK